jgi:hypothetical protein
VRAAVQDRRHGRPHHAHRAAAEGALGLESRLLLVFSLPARALCPLPPPSRPPLPGQAAPQCSPRLCSPLAAVHTCLATPARPRLSSRPHLRLFQSEPCPNPSPLPPKPTHTPSFVQGAGSYLERACNARVGVRFAILDREATKALVFEAAAADASGQGAGGSSEPAPWVAGCDPAIICCAPCACRARRLQAAGCSTQERLDSAHSTHLHS